MGVFIEMERETMNFIKKLFKRKSSDNILNKAYEIIITPTKIKSFEWTQQKLQKKGYKDDEIYKIILNTATNPYNQRMGDKPQKSKENLPIPREVAERENLDYFIWYDKEYNENDKGQFRYEFELWNFGYEDAFNLCGTIWTIFGYDVVLLDFIDLVETQLWHFSINDMSCLWYFNDFPAYHYIIPLNETQENLNKLEDYMKILVNELNRIVIGKIIDPY